MNDLAKILSTVKPGEDISIETIYSNASPRILSNITELHSSFVGADLADENEDNTDWKAIAEERRLATENANAKAAHLQGQIDIHVKRIERWEKQFDSINLPRLLDGIQTNIIDYKTALLALNEFNRDWFIGAQLSEQGKVEFAGALLGVIQRFAPGENTTLLEAISESRADTMNGLWKDNTSQEIED